MTRAVAQARHSRSDWLRSCKPLIMQVVWPWGGKPLCSLLLCVNL